jgi:alkanesulfonate monooxygenase SsuD/methylene tetrahydromethanopterin reductase-like flavin-dependent oxidoreductase (luciferase family)
VKNVKVGLMFVNGGPFSESALFRHLVIGAEGNGFESIWTVEHVVMPDGFKSAYPYTSSGKLGAVGDTPLSDPLLHLAFAAASPHASSLAPQ